MVLRKPAAFLMEAMDLVTTLFLSRAKALTFGQMNKLKKMILNELAICIDQHIQRNNFLFDNILAIPDPRQ